MAKFEIIEGAPGQGKSLYMNVLIIKLLQRNIKWEKDTGVARRIAYNLPLADSFVKAYSKYFVKWREVDELIDFRDVDIIWDEIADVLDSRNWTLLSDAFKRFLSQYRKYGIDIYANTQDFSMVDVRARLMCTRVASLTKIVGSRDLSSTKPDPKHIWGIVWVREVKNLRKAKKNPDEKVLGWFPDFFFIQKHLTDMYDTRGEIKSSGKLVLRHRVAYCELYGQIDPATGKLHDCQFHKVMHV